MRILRIGLLALLLGLVCAAPAAFAENHLQQAADESARIVDFDFSPRQIDVASGDTIQWTNEGARPHTVSDRGGTFDTGPIQPNGSDTVTFSVPGTYYFFCRINPGRMNGVIRVEAEGQARAVRVQASDPAREGDQLGFTPNALSVETGTVVVLANVGGKPHTLTADDGSFDTGIVTPGAGGGKFAGSNASVTVNKAGSFRFHCEVHPEAMKGVLTVTGEDKEGGPAAASQAPREASVDIVDFAFEPNEASVAAGGTVTWRNTGDAQHTATFDDVELDTDTITPGSDAALVAPAEAGSYSYRCNIHPARMRGTLVVVGQNQADPTKPEAVGDVQPTGGEVSGGITMLALLTGVGAAFMGGFAISAFVRNKMGQ